MERSRISSSAARSVKSDYDEGRVLQQAITRARRDSGRGRRGVQRRDAHRRQQRHPVRLRPGGIAHPDAAALIEQSASGWAAAIATIGSSYDRGRAIGAALNPGASAGDRAGCARGGLGHLI